MSVLLFRLYTALGLMIVPDVYAILKDEIVKWYPLLWYFVMMQLRVRFCIGI